MAAILSRLSFSECTNQPRPKSKAYDDAWKVSMQID